MLSLLQAALSKTWCQWHPLSDVFLELPVEDIQDSFSITQPPSQ